MPRPRSTTTLESRIQSLAATFAREVIGALHATPLSDLAALAGQPVDRATEKSAPAPAARAKRKISNYPKCAWAGCGKNRSPRTLPYCGEHFHAVKDGAKPPAGSLGTGPAARKR